MRLLSIACLFFAFTSHAQKTPELFAPNVISQKGVFGFTLSPKGDEAFWVQSNGGRDTLWIMRASYEKGVWKTPELAGFSGKAGWKDVDPIFSPDGKTILFQSTRPVPGKPERTGFDIWAVKKQGKNWSEPYHLGNDINTDASESFASVTNSGSIYFMKDNPDGRGKSDIYVSRLSKGAYTVPENLGLPINTSFRESNPYISPKEDFIIYFSNDSSGYGDVDLFISFREKGGWTKPKNLGPTINSSIAEFCPFYHAQTKKLYFCRQIQSPGKRIKENVWVVSFDPEDYRD
jgi:hypothetical protein